MIHHHLTIKVKISYTLQAILAKALFRLAFHCGQGVLYTIFLRAPITFSGSMSLTRGVAEVTIL